MKKVQNFGGDRKENIVKAERQKKILELISKENIESQEVLIHHLKMFGINATQTTVSRDMKELRIVKVLLDDGKYRYSSPYEEQSPSGKLTRLFLESAKDIFAVSSIVVIKCKPAMAQALALSIDNARVEDIVATVAGVDTIFALCRDDLRAKIVARRLLRIIKG